MKKAFYKTTFGLILSIASINSNAQTIQVATFDDLALSGTDSSYKGADGAKKFISNSVKFNNYYSSGSWGGFAYSKKKDTITAGYSNDLSAIAGGGYNSSLKYATAYSSTYYGGDAILVLPAKDSVMGFYITNGTYATLSIKNGDFSGKKFGGTTGNDPDYLKTTAYGWENGMIKDSVDFFLADYRFSNNANDYIVKNWRWFNLKSLGKVDSISFGFQSSDNHPIFGMNTPSYFCMDNFTFKGITLSLSDIEKSTIENVYPNPFEDHINIVVSAKSTLTLLNIDGRVALKLDLEVGNNTINTNNLFSGIYIVRINNSIESKSFKIVKK